MERRKTIIQEIAYWRDSKLLPEQYCDFLMNLYLDDHSEEAAATWQSVSKSSIRNSHWKLWALICFATVALCVLVLNFNQFPLPIQILLSVFIVITSYVIGIVKTRHNKSLSYASIGMGSIFLLWVGHYLMKLYGVEDAFWVIGYLVSCSIIWILLGFVMRSGLFQFSGWIGLIMFYGWLLHNKIGAAHWLQIQLLWLPLTALFVWLGWLLQHRNKSLGMIYFLIGLLLWFVPDVYLILATESTASWIQVSLLAKIILASVLLFIFRKKWTEWVA